VVNDTTLQDPVARRVPEVSFILMFICEMVPGEVIDGMRGMYPWIDSVSIV
jgi:hypothetical protein